MSYNIAKLKQIMQGIASSVELKEDLGEIKTIAGFDVSFTKDNKVVCAAVVFNANTFEVIEVKKIIKDSPMAFIPGFLAFRKGPAMLEAYYTLENEPDLLIIEGDGILHPDKCGLATFIGVELEKPTIAVEAKQTIGEVKGEDIYLDGELVGKLVKTKEHANPVVVSPGNLITVEKAAELVKKFTFSPHKMPEPIHKAHRIAKKKAQIIQEKGTEQEEKQEEAVNEYDVDKKAIGDFTVGTY